MTKTASNRSAGYTGEQKTVRGSMFRHLIFGETLIGRSLVMSPCRKTKNNFFPAYLLDPIIRPPSAEVLLPPSTHPPEGRVYRNNNEFRPIPLIQPSELLILPPTVANGQNYKHTRSLSSIGSSSRFNVFVGRLRRSRGNPPGDTKPLEPPNLSTPPPNVHTV